MPDEQGGNGNELSPLESRPIERAPQPARYLDRLSERIADSKTPLPESLVLMQIRDEMIRQDEYRLDRAHIRRAETRQFWAKLAFSAGAAGTGIGLIATGFTLEGFVALGIGFHWLAPDFVSRIYDRIFSARERSDAE